MGEHAFVSRGSWSSKGELVGVVAQAAVAREGEGKARRVGEGRCPGRCKRSSPQSPKPRNAAKQSLLMIWGNAWRVTGSPKSSPKSDRLSGANKLLGVKTGGTRRAARMKGVGREGGDGLLCPRVPGEGVSTWGREGWTTVALAPDQTQTRADSVPPGNKLCAAH